MKAEEMMINNKSISEAMLNGDVVFSSGAKIISNTGNWTIRQNFEVVEYTSNSIGHNQVTTERIKFKNAKDCVIKISWNLDSEKSFDYGIFSNIDKTAVNVSQGASNANNLGNSYGKNLGFVVYPKIEDNDEHFIELMYRKDASGTQGRDNIICRFEFFKESAKPGSYLKCIENTAIGTISTEYIPTVNTDIEIKFKVSGFYTSQGMYYGYQNQNTALPIMFMYDGSATTTSFENYGRIRISSYQGRMTANIENDDDFSKNFIHTVKVEGNNIYIDGELASTGTREPDLGKYPIYLFNASQSNMQYSYMRLYYFKIWENGELVREYIPYLNEEGKLGLKDKVNDKFYLNSGQGYIYKS